MSVVFGASRLIRRRQDGLRPGLTPSTVRGRCARSSSATVVGEAVQVRCADGEARYGSRAAETALSSAVKAGRSCLAVVCRISRSTDQ